MTNTTRYVVQPVSKNAKGMHKFMVVDTQRMISVRFTVTEEQAQAYAAERNAAPAKGGAA